MPGFFERQKQRQARWQKQELAVLRANSPLLSSRDRKYYDDLLMALKYLQLNDRILDDDLVKRLRPEDRKYLRIDREGRPLDF